VGKQGTKHGERNPYLIKARNRWAYKVPTIGPDGKEILKPEFFDTKEAARDFKKEFEENNGKPFLRLSKEQTWNLALAVDQYLDTGHKAEFTEVFAFYARHNSLKNSATVEEAIDEYIDYRKPKELELRGSKPKRRERKYRAWAITTYQKRVLTNLTQLKDAFADKTVASLTTNCIKKFLESQDIKEDTYNNKYSDTKQFFQWCIDVKKCLDKNPSDGINELATDDKIPEIYTVDETRRIFRTAITVDPGLIPFLALAAFAGIRTCEIERMKPTDLDFDCQIINIRPEVGKRKGNGGVMPRKIEGLPQAAWSWLKASGEKNLMIDTANLQKRRQMIFQMAGVSIKQNALRHSYSSYAYAHFQDDGPVRKQVGHRIANTFFEYYATVVLKAEGDAYFQILCPVETLPSTGEYKPYGTTKINWPSDENLIRMIKSSSNNKVAKELGVSEAAIRKRLKRIKSKNLPC